MHHTGLFAFWNGRIVPAGDIRVSPFDVGLLRGYGVFDVMRTENGKPFLHDRHWSRFVRSAETLGLVSPVSEKEHWDIVGELIVRNGFPQSSIRTVLSGGESANGFLPEPGRENFLVLVTPFEPLAERYFTQGARLITLEHARAFPHAKITNYIHAIQHAPRRLAADALEILYVKDSRVYEASTSNFLAVVDGVLVAPQLDVLPGITRGLTVELARQEGVPVEERDLSWDEVARADEALLTATNKYIVPVTRIDDHSIGAGVPGRVTRRLMAAMEEFVGKY